MNIEMILSRLDFVESEIGKNKRKIKRNNREIRRSGLSALNTKKFEKAVFRAPKKSDMLRALKQKPKIE